MLFNLLSISRVKTAISTACLYRRDSNFGNHTTTLIICRRTELTFNSLYQQCEAASMPCFLRLGYYIDSLTITFFNFVSNRRNRTIKCLIKSILAQLPQTLTFAPHTSTPKSNLTNHIFQYIYIIYILTSRTANVTILS